MKRSSLPQQLVIEGLSHEGRGISSIAVKKAFVDGALAGETVLAEKVKKRSQFDEWRVIDVEIILILQCRCA